MSHVLSPPKNEAQKLLQDLLRTKFTLRERDTRPNFLRIQSRINELQRQQNALDRQVQINKQTDPSYAKECADESEAYGAEEKALNAIRHVPAAQRDVRWAEYVLNYPASFS